MNIGIIMSKYNPLSQLNSIYINKALVALAIDQKKSRNLHYLNDTTKNIDSKNRGKFSHKRR